MNWRNLFRKKPKLSPEWGQISQYAALYERGKDQISKVPKEVVEEIRNYVTNAYAQVVLNHRVEFQDKELNDFDWIYERFKQDNILYISTMHNQSPLLGKYNLMFRAVHETMHDYLHIQMNCGFDWKGEGEVYQKQIEGLSEDAAIVLFSEIMLQTAFRLWYGYYPEKQKIVLVKPLNAKP